MRIKFPIFFMLGIFIFICDLSAGQGGVKMKPVLIDFSSSPKAVMKCIPLDSVRWTKGFWADRYNQTGQTTVRKLWELLADPKAGHVLENMRIAAGLTNGRFAGTKWQDEWLYKWIEAAACLYRITGDKWLEQRMEEAIELISRAQEKDGYISTQITAQKLERFRDPQDHEIYNMGHLLTSGVIHNRMTGKDSLLKIALRTADFLCQTLGKSVEPYFAHNPSAVMGLVELYRATGIKKYLDCAKLIVDKRGTNPKKIKGLFNHEPGFNGTDAIQDRIPLREENEVVGHNVFFTYLYAGAADVYLETSDETLHTALKRLWHDLVEHKMGINGGVSPMGLGISHNYPVNEAVGPEYFLPNASAYNETCGQIGNFMWNFRMLCSEESAGYVDIMEQALYNGILSGIGLDGESWFYKNPLRRYDKDYEPEGGTDMKERSQPGAKHICCPSNLLRLMAELQSYFYSFSGDGIWVNLYGGNKFSCDLKSGETVSLEQVTDYPWDGKIRIIIQKSLVRPFFIKIRIPGWAEGTEIKINNKKIEQTVKPGTYAVLNKKWAVNDIIEINLPMNSRLIQAHPKAEQLRNQVAIMHGPVLYCLESKDLPENIELNNIYIPSDIALKQGSSADLAFNIRILEGKALYREENKWVSDLYRPLGSNSLQPISLRLIPYFAWLNRGPSAMSVWLPVILKN